MRLVENLYYYLWSGIGNNCHSYLFSSVLRGERPHVLVDPGHISNEIRVNCLGQLIDSMAEDGFKPEDIGLIINTHSHPDHCQANRVLAERGKGRALITLSKIEDEYRRTAGSRMSSLLGVETDFEPDFYLQEGELNLGRERKVSLQILLTPGHSPGSISIYWPKNKVLITGDVMFCGGIGRTDLPGGDGKALKQSIERLAELDVEYLLPGHSTEQGDIIQGKEQVKQNFLLIKMNYFPLL